MGAKRYGNTRGKKGRHKSKIICRNRLENRHRGDTNFSSYLQSYSPKERPSVVEGMGNLGRFASSIIFPRAENKTNSKCKSNAKDECEPESFGLAHSSLIRIWSFCRLLKKIWARRRRFTLKIGAETLATSPIFMGPFKNTQS